MADKVHPDAPASLIAQWDRRRDPMRLAPGESLPAPDADLEVLTRTTVPDPWPLPPKGASHHARKERDLAPEFAGQPTLYLLHAVLVAHLRKRAFPAEAPVLFRRLWAEHDTFLRQGLTTRWLISAIITFGDHGATESERLLGREMGMLFSMMKLYEYERMFSGTTPDRAFRIGHHVGADMPMGMEPFSLSTGGLDINLLAPVWQRALSEPVMGPLACDLMDRLNHDAGTVFARLSVMRAKKQARLAKSGET